MPVEHFQSSGFSLFSIRGGCSLSPAERYDGHRVFVVENKESELDKKTSFWNDDGIHAKMFNDYIPGSHGEIDGSSWFRSMKASEDSTSRTTSTMEKLVKKGNKYELIVRTEYINPGHERQWCVPILRVQILSTAESKRSNFGVPTPCK